MSKKVVPSKSSVKVIGVGNKNLHLSGADKKQAMVDKYGEAQVNELTAKIWLLVGVLNASRFAIAEMEPKKMSFAMKKRFNDLEVAVNLFLNSFKSAAPQAEREILDATSFDTVGTLAELMCMVVQCPLDQLDWYLEECKKMVFLAYNKHKVENGSKESKGISRSEK